MQIIFYKAAFNEVKEFFWPEKHRIAGLNNKLFQYQIFNSVLNLHQYQQNHYLANTA